MVSYSTVTSPPLEMRKTSEASASQELLLIMPQLKTHEGDGFLIFYKYCVPNSVRVCVCVYPIFFICAVDLRYRPKLLKHVDEL